MLTHLALSSAFLLGPSALPDALDHLKSADIKPNIGLLLDSSCSMDDGSGKIWTDCVWYASTYTGGNLLMSKKDVMKAVLVGCRKPGDGLLDRYYNKAQFSMFHFGNGNASRVADFNSGLAGIKAAALGIPAKGGTPMTRGIRDHGAYFGSYFTNSNTLQCRPNFLLLLSDGNPNGGGATFDFNCPAPGDPKETREVAAGQPWLGSEYLYSHKDSLCGVTGEQNISTYSIGFGAPGSFSPTNLQNISKNGGGLYFYASDFAQLDVAFDSILKAMSSRTGLFFAAPAVQTQGGLFSENILYAAAFRPAARGRWNGTVKKHCIEPRRLTTGSYDTGDMRCMFHSPDGKTLYTNPNLRDMWTGTSSTGAMIGGSAAILLDRITSDGHQPKAPYWPRHIVTWRPEDKKYVRVHKDELTRDDTLAPPEVHHNLINLIHGYGYSSRPNGDPLVVAPWPLGDPVHTPLGMLRYGDCEAGPGRCYVVAGANDGQLHFFDSYTGEETTSLVPFEFMRLNGIATNQLREVNDQPSEDFTHRYYVDGGLVVLHDDLNGDGVIQPNEQASIIFGLGRGGAAFYKIDVRQFNGKLDTKMNPIYPLVYTEGNVYHEIQWSFSNPWVGPARVGGVKRNVAAFVSGHVGEFDRPDWPQPSKTMEKIQHNFESNLNGCPAMAQKNDFLKESCGFWSGSGYPDPAPMDIKFGPIKRKRGKAYRFKFSGFDMDPNDQIFLEDSQGNYIMDLRTAVAKEWTDWVYDKEFYIRVITDGKQTKHRGFSVGQVDVLWQDYRTFREHYPTVYVVDVEKWSGVEPFQQTANENGLLIQFARKCTSKLGLCVDGTQNPDLKEMTCPISSDVAVYTVAGIADAIYWGDECGQLWKAWRTDQDGTAWKAKRLIALNNTIGRLGSQVDIAEPKGKYNMGMKTFETGDQVFELPAGVGQSKDFRKIFRRLDIVASTCPGSRVVGIYFGTGNLQRPASLDELENPNLNSGRDVVGVIWDSPALPDKADINTLFDATKVAKVDPRKLSLNKQHGWYLQLGKNERMLRDPLVLEGLAYYKTYQPVSGASECSVAKGRDRVYVVDNCSAEAFLDRNGNGLKEAGERAAWEGNDEIGGNFLLVTPPDGPPIVSHGSLTTSAPAKLADYRRSRVPSIFSWREPRSI